MCTAQPPFHHLSKPVVPLDVALLTWPPHQKTAIQPAPQHLQTAAKQLCLALQHASSSSEHAAASKHAAYQLAVSAGSLMLPGLCPHTLNKDKVMQAMQGVA
jgi:hypothetical protein